MSNGSIADATRIKGFYDARKSRGRRAARHVFTNLRLRARERRIAPRNRDPDALCLRRRAALSDRSAILISDYNDVYVRGADGAWRYRSRTIVPVFGGVPVLAGPGSKPVSAVVDFGRSLVVRFDSSFARVRRREAPGPCRRLAPLVVVDGSPRAASVMSISSRPSMSCRIAERRDIE